MKKFYFLVLLLCFSTSTLGAPPTTIPITIPTTTTTTIANSCWDDDDCEDNNPCTYDDCDLGYCDYIPWDSLMPCDDGLYCNGTDNCSDDYDGLCSVHSGDPCPAGTVCNEVTDSCDSIPTTSTTTSVNQTTTSTSTVSSTTTILPSTESFAISGHIKGVISQDVVVLLAGTASRAWMTDTNGYYEFSNLLSGYYTIKPEKDGYSFEPPNYVIQDLTSDLQGIDFEATKILCPIEIFCGENSEEAELLRYFRDDILSRTLQGQELIKLYYQWSPLLLEAMQEDEKFKEEVLEMIHEALPLIRGKIE